MTTWLLLAWLCAGPCHWQIIGSATSEDGCLQLAFQISKVGRTVECVKVTQP